MKSIGIDIVEIKRLEEDFSKYGNRFVERILSDEEFERFDQRMDKLQFLAGRFAAKEAIVKALGYYLAQKPRLTQISILNSDSGQPQVRFPQEVEAVLNGARCLISISHEKNYAAAVAAFVEDK